MNPSGAIWKKSTRSTQGDCVEVATNLPDLVAVRDSKDQAGPTLTFPHQEWRHFLANLDK